MNRRLDLSWQKIWMVSIISFIEVRKNKSRFKCLCDCWKEFECVWAGLSSWNTKSCGCYSRKRTSEIHGKHFMCDTRFYKIRTDMKKRCENKNSHAYNRYWWRWIKVEWKSFEEYKDDMYDSYLKHVEEFWEKQTTIDRKNTNWNYCKENCKRATYEEQCNNKRNNKNVTYQWITLSQTQRAKRMWIWIKTLRYRLNHRPLERAMSLNPWWK